MNERTRRARDDRVLKASNLVRRWPLFVVVKRVFEQNGSIIIAAICASAHL